MYYVEGNQIFFWLHGRSMDKKCYQLTRRSHFCKFNWIPCLEMEFIHTEGRGKKTEFCTLLSLQYKEERYFTSQFLTLYTRGNSRHFLNTRGQCRHL